MPRKQIGIKMDSDLFDWVKEQAQEVNRTPSNFIEYVLMLYKKGKTKNEA